MAKKKRYDKYFVAAMNAATNSCILKSYLNRRIDEAMTGRHMLEVMRAVTLNEKMENNPILDQAVEEVCGYVDGVLDGLKVKHAVKRTVKRRKGTSDG